MLSPSRELAHGGQAAHTSYALSTASDAQMLALRAATGNALTTFFAGLAFTMVILPKISLLPALVAGFMRVLMRQRPGRVKMPAFLTSAVPISARVLMTLAATVFFSSHCVATASAIAPLVMALPPAFIAFMGAMVEGGARSTGVRAQEDCQLE